MKRNRRCAQPVSLSKQQGSFLGKLVPGLVAGAIEFRLFYTHCRPLWPYIATLALGVAIWWLQRLVPRRKRAKSSLVADLEEG